MSPPAPWSQANSLIPGSDTGTQYKPAICDHEGQVFLAWARSSDTSSNDPSFSFSRWLASDNGWAPPKLVPFSDPSRYQSDTSALVVFHGVLYAFVPFSSSGDGGMAIFSYDGNTFNFVCDWGSVWSTPIAAVVFKETLHVVGYNESNGDHFNWTWTNDGLKTITGPGDFSANTTIDESSTSNPALVVRQDHVSLFFLTSNDSRAVTECKLTDDNTWVRGPTIGQSGNSGISATSTPDGQHTWICFKTHNGRTNLMCNWKVKASSWSNNTSMGSGTTLECANEAALVVSGDWVYAVWNTYPNNQPMYYSRRPLKQVEMDSWMGELDNQDIPISMLSIPGTHDSATSSYSTFIAKRWVRCQDMSIAEQLDAGIRYFDLRGGYDGSSAPLGAFHGKVYLGLTFAEIFQIFETWLSTHSTEAIIVQVKRDQDSADNQQVANDLYKLIGDNDNWVTTDTIPQLSQIRGKMLLVRRTPMPQNLGQGIPFGINASDWPWNKQDTITYPAQSLANVSLTIEDFCSYEKAGPSALKDKTQRMQTFVDQANSNADPSNWFIGYSSYMTEGSVPDSSENYATEALGGQTPLNTALEQHIRSKWSIGNPACVGTIVMDFPESPGGSLIQSIVYSNAIKST
ncbi:phosphatidylinositol diacylglycerol-lyase [Fusarium langsethiae]|uniref:Phosphatidylinositol diacylglycerol-lyase n=1 Tax=Fusarium langsethiae TaxID=179993 RepID=A0A0M9EVB8_FUSLA|nr:phosphatidylinositol diacylglycerol-lyase [Fusarium langsethiae]GKU07506.1 unnamed protein product [Fusarium langsethiae]